MENSNAKKILKNSLFFLGIIFLTYYFVLRKTNINEIFNITKSASAIFVSLAIISMLFFFIWESFNLKFLLKSVDQEISIFKSFRYTLLCFFFSGITPGATGGQPVEVYYMNKDGIEGSKATLAVLVQLFSYKIACLSLALFAFLIHYFKLNQFCKIAFIVGFIIYLIPLLLIILCLFKPSFIVRISNFIINFLYRIGIKKPREKQNKIDAEIDKYNEYAAFLKNNANIFIKSICLSLLGVLCSYFVSYYVYLALGFNEYGFFTIVTKQSLLYAMASWIPLPGAIGASEFAYLTIFGEIYSNEALVSAMLLARGITFYLFIVVGFFAYLYTKIKNK